MEEKIRRYVDDVFSKVKDAESLRELKEELTANLIDKWNDLIKQGKSAEEAYREAIQSVGGAADYGFLPRWENAQEQERFHGMQVVRECAIREPIDNITLDWCVGGVQFLKSENDAIKIVQKAGKELSEDCLFTYNVMSNSLSVRDNNRIFGREWLGRWIAPINTYLEFYLPQRLFNRIEIKSASGFVKADCLKAEALSTTNSSGSLRMFGSFERINCRNSSGVTQVSTDRPATADGTNSSGKLLLGGSIEKLNVRNSSGKVELNLSEGCALGLRCTSGRADVYGKIRSLDMNVSSGKVTVASDCMPEKMNVQIASGVIDFTMPEAAEGFSMRMNKSSGAIQTDFPVTSSSAYEKVYGNGAYPYEVNISSGIFRLNRRN